MNSKKNFISLSSEKIVNKINDLTIGEDSNDYLTVNSETRFHSDVNVGGSSIRLHSSDDTNPNNFISILDQDIHSVHAQTLRKIHDLQIDDNNNGKYLKFDDSSGVVASTVSGGGGGGGSGIVNNRIDGDLTIGEDDSEMLTIASKLHIPGGKSGQVLTKGTDGSIEYGPTAFPSISHKVTTIAFSVYSDGTGDDDVYDAAMPFNTVIFNKGGSEFNTSTYKYKVKTEGVYYIWFYWYTNDSATTGVRCYIMKNNNILTNHGKHAGMSNEGGFLVDLAVDDEIWLKAGNSSYNVTYYAEELHNGFGAFLVGGSTTFTTANPLLANPSTADKGKIVTVNAAGDDLQYGPQVLKHNMNFKNIYETGSFTISASTANNNPRVHDKMNITITPQLTTSKVMITVNMFGELTTDVDSGVVASTMAYLRRTVNGVVTDLLPPVVGDSNRGLGQFVLSFWYDQDGESTPEVCNFHYVDEPNTTSEVSYDVLLVSSSNTAFHYNKTVDAHPAHNKANEEKGMSFMSVEEKFANDDGAVGAITSFTQEQALAGAGGTAAFTNTYKDESGDSDLSGMDDPRIAFNNTINNTANSGYWHNQPYNSLSDLQNQLPIQIGVNFTTPQIVTKYRIWARISPYQNQAPKSWQIRAAINKATYDSGTFIILDSRSDVTSFPATSTSTPSDNLSTANEYNLSTIGAYKYYVFYFTESNGGSNGYYMAIGELALYGGGFTIPSQIGHSGKTLKTNGTALEWSAPLTGLLPPPVPENKGKIVTVNAAGDDLEYGANFRELACKQTLITNGIEINDSTLVDDVWVDLASHLSTDNINISMNTETLVNVPQNAKLEIQAQITFGHADNTAELHFGIRLGKKVNGNIIWGHTSGVISITDSTNNALSDPKGDALGNRTRAWKSEYSKYGGNAAQFFTTTINASFIDEDPTNGLSGYHDVTYFLRVTNLYPDSASLPFTIGYNQRPSSTQNRTTSPTIIIVKEIGSGVITSFTQEQALAGAGGTAAFTNAVSGIDTGYGSKDNLNDNKLYSDSSNASLYNAQICSLLKGGNAYWFYSVTFTTPQIVTKYIIWGRGDGSTSDQNPRDWEFRGATDSSTYNATDSTTYTVLDSQVSATFNSYTSTANASDNLSLGNVYNLSTIGAYKHYVLHITANGNNAGTGNHNTHCTMAEIALYGGGFTIPSQIGHSGKTLKTNGTALEWSAPLTGLLPPPVPENKGKIVTVNAAGDDLEYGANIQEKNYKYKMLTGRNPLTISGRPNDNSTNYTIGAGAVLFNDGTDNLEVTITPVSNSSQILISANIMGEFGNDGGDSGWGFFTLQKTQNGVSSLIYPSTYNSYLSSANINYHSGDANSTIESSSFKYVDILTSNSPVTYCVAVVTETTDGQHRFYTNGCEGSSSNSGFERGLSMITAEELGGNAITSFTQEQALAGAGGTAAFTASTTAHAGHETLTSLHDNNTANNSFGIYFTLNFNTVSTTEVAYEFDTPQIITKYKMWPRANTPSGDRKQNPKAWELRAATDSSAYNSGNGTYTVLDSQSLPGADTEAGAKIGWKIDALIAEHNAGNTLASNLTHLANEYTLSTIGAYKYYVLHFTDNYGDNHIALAEWALYGGGFTIPSQIGHTGRLLTTDGTSLGWATTAALPSVTVPEPTSTNKGKALVSTGTGIEFSDFNSGVSTGFKVYKSGTAFEEVTTNTAVLFDQTTTNVGAGSYSTTAGTYTVPVTGYYNIFANFTLPTVIWCGYANQAPSGGFYANYDDGTQIERFPGEHPGLINDTNGSFNTTTGIFTCSIPGIYRINLFSIGVTQSRANLGLYKNDAKLFEILDIASSGNYQDNGNTIIIELISNDTLRIKEDAGDSEIMFSGELIKSGIDYRIQKSTNSGTTYTDLATSSDKPTTSIVESLNQNNLIRVISGDGSTGSILNLQQGTTKNSFGAHLLNSGNSTSPIPIYGFFVEKSNNGGSSVITTSGTDTTISGWNIDGTNHFILPSSNFDLTNGVYTIPLSGYYQVTATIRTTRGDGSRINISVNNQNTGGSLHIQTYQVTDQQDAWSLNGILKLNTNDTIRIKIQASGFQYNADDTHWSCFLLASDTQTNTRQMGLSSIVPLHQLGHDQFADGVFSIMEYSSSTNTGNIDNRSVDGDKLNEITSSNITSYKLSDSSISTVKYNLGSTDYTTVPGSPHTNWTDSTDYIQIALFVDFQIDSLNNFFTTGSFTIDLSKILTNFIGLWNVGIQWDEDLRININNEMFYFDSHSGGNTHYKNININNRYINCTFNHQESSGGERVNLYFYRICSIPQQAIAEPVMPSITLPTPNSNNNGKVLVSNGSGYALQPNSGYVPVYGFNANLNSNYTSTANGIIDNWSISGNNHFALPSANFNASSGVYTIPISGYYQINAIIRIDAINGAGLNRIYISVNNTTQAFDTTSCNLIFKSDYTSSGGNSYASGTINTILKLNINDTISLKTEHQDGSVSNDDTHWSCMLLNTTEVNATPSINIPLPVATNAGKSLTVNSAGTGLEYDDSGIVLQIQKTLFTDWYYASGLTDETWHNLSQLNTNITPKYNNSLILINVNIGRIDCDDSSTVVYKIMRDNSDIQSIGDDNVRATWSSNERHGDDNHAGGVSFTIFDSPNTTNQVNYKLFYDVEGDKIVVNKNMNQGRNNTVYNGFLHAKTMSNMILTEIKQ